ncbi:MAG: Gfo/Idh/MocA family protein [Paludibacteraceae bacterium]
MKKKTFSVLLLAILFLSSSSIADAAKIIKTKVPKRKAGQTNVLQLATEPLPTIRVAFIGLGMRGPGAVSRMTHIDGVEIVALCDVEQDRVEKVNKMLEKRGFPKAQEFYGDTEVWRKVSALPNVDLIYVATDWASHAKIGVQAMKDGKHVAIEVPAAMNLDEIWSLINTSEQTRKHCMQLENCVYDFFELTTLNMAQQGLFGEILHTEGAYIHNLEPFWKDYWRNWRLEYNIAHHGDLYPTHGIGPVCQALNIHRGDKMNYLVSMATKTVCIPEFIKETTGRDVSKDFKNGDHTITLIQTEKGKTINIQHNVATPRPYNRMYQLTGTKGFANKYPIRGYAFAKGQVGESITPNFEKLDGHSFVPDAVRDTLLQRYVHPIARDIAEKAKSVGGHGGMDFIMDYRLIYCLQKGLPLDMDVYDLAEWCCLIPLTEISLNNKSAAVEIPDFTRGAWDKLDSLKFAQ